MTRLQLKHVKGKGIRYRVVANFFHFSLATLEESTNWLLR